MKLLSIQDKNEYDLWKPTEKCLRWPIFTRILVAIVFRVTAWKVSVFGVFLVRIFPHLDWILEIVRISPYSVEMRENTDQKTLNTDTFHEPCVLTCSSVHYSISVYNVTTLKAIKKNSKYCLVCEAPLIDRVFENIFRQCFG